MADGPALVIPELNLAQRLDDLADDLCHTVIEPRPALIAEVVDALTAAAREIDRLTEQRDELAESTTDLLEEIAALAHEASQ